MSSDCKPDPFLKPRKLAFSWLDYLLALAEWINAFGNARLLVIDTRGINPPGTGCGCGSSQGGISKGGCG